MVILHLLRRLHGVHNITNDSSYECDNDGFPSTVGWYAVCGLRFSVLENLISRTLWLLILLEVVVGGNAEMVVVAKGGSVHSGAMASIWAIAI